MNIATKSFTDALEEALKHYRDLAWLGEHSPLASPYFLGSQLSTPATTPNARGRALQTLLQEATASLEGKNAERFQTILREYYFHDRPAAVVWDLVGLGKNSFHLSRNSAIAALEEKLVDRIQPALRLEHPPQVESLLERQHESAIALTILHKQQSVAVLGASGIGKSAFAAYVAQKLARPTFWYTIRPGLNDQVDSLLFALALFAHQQGVSGLWLALHSNSQQVVNEQMLGILRHTLTQIDPTPLLCLDNLEHLQVRQNTSHAALINLLESLQGLVPFLWIGERVPIPSDEYVTLSGLSTAGVTEWIERSGISITATQRKEIYALTQGNPRLLQLALASLASGEAHSALPADPALEAILARMLSRLTNEEQNILKALSVYRTPVSMYPWQTRELGPILNTLLEKQVVQSDGFGSIEVPLIYRQLIYRQLTSEQRRQFHTQAAEVSGQNGAYTAAAYHWIEAGDSESALALWRTHHRRELAQGQAAAAYAIFHTLASTPQTSSQANVIREVVREVIREQAALICAQIDAIHGYSERVLQQVEPANYSTPVLAVEAGEVMGVAANDRSEFAKADHAFQQALSVAESLVEVRMAHLRKGRAWMHLRQRDLDQAERELGYAHYEIENMRGNLAFDRGHYAQAQTHYLNALSLANELSYTEGIGKTRNNLAGVALWLGQFEDARHDLDAAFTAYQSIGKVADMAGIRITLAVTYNQAGDPTAALVALAEAQTLLSQLGELTTWQQALIAQAKAEAYRGLGQLEAAEVHVKIAIASQEIGILPDAYRVYGEICLQRGEFVGAEGYLRKSLARAEENEDRFLSAYAWRSLGELQMAMGQLAEAEGSFGQAKQLFTELSLTHELANRHTL